MKINSTRLFLKMIFLLAIGFNLSQCFIQKKYEIQDLTTNSQLCFQKEVSSWSTSVTDPKSSMYSKCQETFILGGFDWSPSIKQNYQTLKRLYNGLPEHKYIRFTFSFWAMDSWDYYNSSSYDRFELQFDSLPVMNGWGLRSDNFPGKLCGKEKYLDIADIRGFGWVEHSASSLFLQFRSRMDQETTDESFGIRGIKLIFTDIMPSGPSLCAYTGGPPVYQHTPCVCPTGRYSETGSSSGCIGCHEDCESCYGAGPDKCYVCAKGRYFDGERCVKCHAGCAECSGPKAEECTACDVGFVLFSGKCIAENRCKSPFILDICTRDCQSPCAAQKISLWEELCFPSCPEKEISDLEANCLRCESMIVQYLKATDVGHQYTIKLYPSSCDLDIQTVRRYIKMSEAVQGSVGSFTFEVTRTGANQYFVDLVLGGDVLESTTLNVKLSYLQGTMPVPKKFVPGPTLEEIAKMIPTAKGVLKGFTSGSIIGSLLIGASASLWSIISFQQFVGYFIYINIEFPYQTELFLMLLQSSLWDMLPNPLARMMSSLSEGILKEDAAAVTVYDPPAKFVKYNVSSFFVENGGTIIAVNLALPVLLWLVIGLRKTKCLKESLIMEKIEGVLRWNFITRSFLENGIPLSLAVFLQFRIMMFNNLYLTLCCAFAIFSFLLTVGFICTLCLVLKKRDNQQLKKSSIEEVYGTLYEGIVLATRSTKYYNIVILLRGILVVCLVSFFEAVPLFQIAPLILFNASLVYYMFNNVPFEDKKLTRIVRIKEIFILGAELCIFCLLFGGKSQFYYDLIGYLVLGFLSTALAIEMIYMFALQIIELKNLPRNVKKMWKNLKEVLNKCLKNRKPSIRTKYRLDTTVIRIRPHETSGELSALTFRSENKGELKF